MEDTPEAFGLVVQRRKIGELPAEQPVQLDLFGDGFCDVADESTMHGIYLYRAIATNPDEYGFSCSEVVHWYNQRGECLKNRMKELRSDFAAALLLTQCGRSRAITLRGRHYATVGQIVRHARQWTLQVNPECHSQLAQAIRTIRTFRFP